jgi:hypothetical protein
MAVAALIAGIGLTGCGRGGGGSAPAVGSASGGATALPIVHSSSPTKVTGSPALITKNTVRLGGSDPIADAAAVARAVYPGLTTDTRPQAVALVDSRDWRTAVAASSLMSSPLGAPLLFTTGGKVPSETADALKAMAPRGGGIVAAPLIRIGSAALPTGYSARELPGTDPIALATSIEQLSAAARGSLPHQVLIVNANGSPQYAMPAAALAAESGAPVLFVTSGGLPAGTRSALWALQQPTMYVVGPASQVSESTVAQLQRFGTVRRMSGANPITNAIAVAQFTDGTFGWRVREPGHGLVFVNSARPLDAAAAAPLSASGDYGPLLLLNSATAIAPAMTSFLASIQPGYTNDPRFAPVRGVYNRGWLIGDQRAVSDTIQARLDALLEITPRNTPPSDVPLVP